MRLFKNLTIFTTIVFSFATFASNNEITAITLNNDEVIFPVHDIIKMNRGSFDLFDGRRINTSEIKKIEINDSNGDSKIISKSFFKFISVMRAGGDATGGG
jgi:hypothetical protein